MMRVYIDEGDDGTAAFNETAPEINPCNVTELVSLFFAELKRIPKTQTSDVSHPCMNCPPPQIRVPADDVNMRRPGEVVQHKVAPHSVRMTFAFVPS